MNYYIQGDAAKADQIKAAFERFGYEVIWDNDIADENYINITRKDDEGNPYVDTLVFSRHLLEILKTHPDYQELELPVEPKFKVVDWVVWTEPKGDKPAEPVKIIKLIDEDQLYRVDMGNGICHISYDMQDYYKLAPKPHYDIKNFKPKQWVLTRDISEWEWELTMFAYLNSDGVSKFTCINGVTFKQCIPLNDETKHLLGTTDMPSEEYINW